MSQPHAPFSRALSAQVDDLEKELIEFRRDVHAHPELAWAEERTTDRVAERLSVEGVDVKLMPQSGLLAEIGDASESMPCAFEGEPMEIAFNPQFFIEGIESVETEEIVLRLTSPLRPGLLQAAGSEDFSYLVMPIRLTV